MFASPKRCQRAVFQNRLLDKVNERHEKACTSVSQSICESHVDSSAGFCFIQWNFVVNEGNELSPFGPIVIHVNCFHIKPCS